MGRPTLLRRQHVIVQCPPEQKSRVASGAHSAKHFLLVAVAQLPGNDIKYISEVSTNRNRDLQASKVA